MASFNVSNNWGKFLAKQGFRVEPNKTYVPPVFPITRHSGSEGIERPMRLFAPVGIAGNKAKSWFNELFRKDHKAIKADCGCCDHIVPNYPFQD